jgi:AAA+ ATPase superfamily predicted ATPase
MSSPPFFDRERELATLESIWQQPAAQLVTVWGRRRVGKSTLLARFAPGRRAIYVYGTRLPEQAVLADLASQVAQVFDEPFLQSASFPNWTAALDYLLSRARQERLLLILDEFPYLCEATPGLDTLVQRWWDQQASGADVMIVIAGSSFGAMQALTGLTGALHGRRTAQLDLRPFDYWDSSAFYPHLSTADRVRAYACVGGMPAYLRHWQPDESLPAFIIRTLLDPHHPLGTEGEDLVRTEFHHEALYAAILRAVAGKAERASAIARLIGRNSVAEIADALRRLQEMHLLIREVPITDHDNPRPRQTLYRLADPYLRMYYHFVAPQRALLQLGQGQAVWQRAIAPAFDAFVASTTWEEVARQALWRRIAADALPVPVAQLGRWWDGDSEFDLVGLWEGRATLVGECKWTNAPLSFGDFLRLRQRSNALPLAERPLWVLASRAGFSREVLQHQGEQMLLLTPNECYQTPE